MNNSLFIQFSIARKNLLPITKNNTLISLDLVAISVHDTIIIDLNQAIPLTTNDFSYNN
jgi:hypothetical protein